MRPLEKSLIFSQRVIFDGFTPTPPLPEVNDDS